MLIPLHFPSLTAIQVIDDGSQQADHVGAGDGRPLLLRGACTFTRVGYRNLNLKF